jgi:hypothetical protein
MLNYEGVTPLCGLSRLSTSTDVNRKLTGGALETHDDPQRCIDAAHLVEMEVPNTFAKTTWIDGGRLFG